MEGGRAIWSALKRLSRDHPKTKLADQNRNGNKIKTESRNNTEWETEQDQVGLLNWPWVLAKG